MGTPRPDGSPVSIGLPAAGLGDTTDAFAWLERAAEAHGTSAEPVSGAACHTG